jgi:hypothetical protein
MALATLMPGGAASQVPTVDTAQVTLSGAPAALTAPASAPATASGNPHALFAV